MKEHIRTLLSSINTITKLNRKLFLIVTSLSIFSIIFPFLTLGITQQLLNTIQTLSAPFETITWLIVLYCSITIFGMIIQSIYSYFSFQLSTYVSYRMNYLLMEKCANLSLEDLEKTETYDMITRLEGEVSSKPYQALMGLIGLISTSVTFVVALIILFMWRLDLFIYLVIISIIAFACELKIADQEFQVRYERSDKEREAWYYSFLLTRDTAFKEVKMLKLKDYFLNRYWKLVTTFIKMDNGINRKRILLNLAVSLIQDIMAGFIMFIAIRETYLGTALLGTALFYISISGMIRNSTSSLAGNFYALYNSNLYMGLLEEFLDLKERKVYNGYVLEKITNIKMNAVDYTYQTGATVLHNINFEILQGECVAIVGENGSGKSTLLKLLCGLYIPANGMIEVNGKNLADIDEDSYKNHISVLFQDFLKLEDSLLENIKIGWLEQQVQKSHIKASLTRANVNFLLDEEEDYIYEKYLGSWFEGGSQLSGGQWQKIALARTFYKEASIYFLDEPSSALDANSELKVFEYFFEKSIDKIGIFVTHRIKLAQRADKIIVLDQGQIVGVGTHDELYENCELYRTLLKKEREVH